MTIRQLLNSVGHQWRQRRGPEAPTTTTTTTPVQYELPQAENRRNKCRGNTENRGCYSCHRQCGGAAASILEDYRARLGG